MNRRADLAPTTWVTTDRILIYETRGPHSTSCHGRAVVQLDLADRDTSDVDNARQLAYYQMGVVQAQFRLVYLPGILSAGSVAHSQILQLFAQAGDFPFAELVVPMTKSNIPLNSLSVPGSMYDLTCRKTIV